MKKRKIKKRSLVLIAGLFSLAIYSGCSETNNESQKPENLLENVEEEELENNINLADSFLEANAEFSLDLFEKIASEANAVFSPVAVYNTLALIANGANDDAKSEIIASLKLEYLDSEEMNRYYYGLSKNFQAKKDEVNLALSNSIWYDKDFEANEEYLRTNKTYYDADSFKIDFSDSNAANQMNDWVEDETNGKIEKIVDEIGSEAVMYLFSTVYFDAEWEHPFKGSHSYTGDFVAEDEAIELEKMTEQFEMNHLITKDEEAVLLPYSGDDYSFVALMPREGISVREYLKTLDIEKIKTLSQSIEKDEIDLHLPKFTVNFEKTLNDPLKDLGISRIFDLSENSLEKMGKADGNLFVNKILQKTYFRVDEEGTEAASAVSSEIDTTSLPIEARVIDFNRPFLYGVVDNETKLPIFLGLMDRPE